MLDSGLQGRTCLVTGGASGIGLQAVRILLEQGAHVVAADLPGERLDAVPVVEGGAGTLLRLPVDVTDPGSVTGLFAAIHEGLGPVHAVVHCAGIYRCAPVAEVDVAEWDAVLDVNLRGSFLVSQAAFADMAAAGDGRIVLFGSFAARTGGLRAGAPYAASKAGVAGLMRHLAQHGGPRGIRVNCIHPGFLQTPMNAGLGPVAEAEAIAATPLRRLASAAEGAAMAVVLVSDLSSFVHGVELDVNGGMYMA